MMLYVGRRMEDDLQPLEDDLQTTEDDLQTMEDDQGMTKIFIFKLTRPV